MGSIEEMYRWAELNLYGLLGVGTGASSTIIGINSIINSGPTPENIAALVSGVALTGLAVGKINRQERRFEKLLRRLDGLDPNAVVPQLYEAFLYAPCTRRSLRLALREKVDPDVWREKFRPQYPVICAFGHFLPKYIC